MILRFLLFGLLPLLTIRPIAVIPRQGTTPTSITLSVSPSPVLFGQPVNFIASVQPSNATGLVTFYSGVTVLGVATVSSGQATFVTALLPAGSNVLTARFDGSATLAASVSPGAPLSVGVMPGTGFGGGVSYPIGLTPVWVATADFNNDGIADLVTANAGEGAVSVFLGNGDGSFQQMPDVVTGHSPAWVMAADFNGDGAPDLAVVNTDDASVSILLGNGDGTFQPPMPNPLSFSPVAATMADFNGDGNVDLAVVDLADDNVTILLGAGDGTFSVSTPIELGFSATQITAADLNGDGKPDLAIAGFGPDGVIVLLGNGDGTFALEPLLAAGTNPSSIAAGDFNGDGKIDLAVGDDGDFNSLNGGGIEILLGNGDGSFKNPIVAASGPNVSGLATGDFDGDGRLDIGVVTGADFLIYLGNGDGTLQTPQSYQAGDSPDALAVGSFDGTALSEVAVVNNSESQLDVLTGSAGTCAFSLTPSSLLYDASTAGGTASLTSNATGCPWTLNSDSWIVPQTAAGLGGGTVSFQIQANATGFDRAGSLVAGGQTVAISQRFTAQQFTDVPATGYNFDAVNLLKNQGITAGCGPELYCPNDSVTRAEMAIFMVRGVYGGDNFTSSPNAYFNDVPPSAFGFRWIQKLFELGVTAGCGTNLYCPESFVTRAQMAIFIIRVRFGATASFSSPPTAYFTDVPVGEFAFAWIQRMRLDGITSGCSATLYCPNGSVTRGDMAIFIMRGLFNDLYPEGTPALVSVFPAVLTPGQPATFTFTGLNTSFAQGQTTVSTIPHVTATDIQVANSTTFSAILSADSSAPVQPVSLVAITGSEEDVLPNSVTIQ